MLLYLNLHQEIVHLSHLCETLSEAEASKELQLGESGEQELLWQHKGLLQENCSPKIAFSGQID